ncbi:MAG TPA: PilZ domain-containing protein [Bryobacteraceae bacterium]|nr:PilZ domain-containing protein [Bryobacteraceae bacterium]
MSPHQTVPADRRHTDRFPIERDVHYRVLNKRGGEETGDGKTLNISSSGVLFTTEHLLLPGRRLELSINWPAQLNDKCGLKLVARGRIVRFEQGRVALEIQQYEFRTSAAGSSATASTGTNEPAGSSASPFVN